MARSSGGGHPCADFESRTFEANSGVKRQVARLPCENPKRPVKICLRESEAGRQAINQAEVPSPIRREQLANPILSKDPRIFVIADDAGHEDTAALHHPKVLQAAAEQRRFG